MAEQVSDALLVARLHDCLAMQDAPNSVVMDCLFRPQSWTESTFFYPAMFVLVLVYLLPTFIAATRDRQYRAAIIALNILLGWTFIGWVGALCWALSLKRERDLQTGAAR
jgi:T4 superinfection immunity protein